MGTKAARLSLITLMFLVLTSGIVSVPRAYAEFAKVRLGVSGMI